MPAAPAGCDCCGADAGRRTALKAVAGAVLVAGVGVRPASADEGPRKGDWLVLADDETHKPLTAADVKAGEKPLVAYPYDPAAKAARDSTRLNRILLVKIDPSTMDAATAPRAADGVLAYSAFCTHQGCDVNSWVAAEKALLCYCHFSKFAPQQEAAVVGGPAPRPLPALPLAAQDGKLMVAGAFTSAPGKAA
jgi:Rieske Fe-S protein